MGSNARTDFLTPASSYLTGLGSCLNIAGNYYEYNVSKSESKADEKAIYMDWKMVGNDLRKAMGIK